MKKYKIFDTRFGKLIKLSFGEEIGNAVSHGVMAILLLLALPACAVFGYVKDGIELSLGYSVFIICLFLMFLMSCLYHSMRFNSSHKNIFRILDHSAIYLAIAGTFTPICLSMIQGSIGIIVLALQWLAVLFGIIYKSISKMKTPKSNTLIYLLMGWSAVLLIPQLVGSQNWGLIAFIVSGGVLYSIGVIFYAQKTTPWFHFIWHIFIILASVCHFCAIIFCM